MKHELMAEAISNAMARQRGEHGPECSKVGKGWVHLVAHRPEVTDEQYWKDQDAYIDKLRGKEDASSTEAE